MLKFIIIREIGNRDTDSGSNYPKKKRRELIWRRCQRVTVYCIICVQWIYQKAFLNCLCQYLSFLNIFPIDFARWKKLFQIGCVNIYLFSIFFFNRFCPAEKSGVPKENARKKVPQKKSFEFFLQKLKPTFWIENLKLSLKLHFE